MADLLMSLVKLDTSSPLKKSYKDAVKLLVETGKSIGLKYEVYVAKNNDVKQIDDLERLNEYIGSGYIPNLIFRLAEAAHNKPTVLFVSHFDVVPPGGGWDFEPFEPFIRDGKLYGRGAADDKSGVVTSFSGLKEVLDSGLELKVNPVLAIAGGEETGSSIGFFRYIMGDLAIVLDVGHEGLSIGASGVIKVKVEVKGRGGHSAYPYRCVNPIYHASRLISYMEAYSKDLLKRKVSMYAAPSHYDRVPARLNVTVVKAGERVNMIPEEVEILIDRRTIPEESESEVAMKLKNLIEEFAEKNRIKVNVDVKILMNSWVTKDSELIKKMSSLLAEVTGFKPKIVVELGGTDGAFLQDRMPVIQYGAMREDNNIHGPNEFVYIEDLSLVRDFVKKILVKGVT